MTRMTTMLLAALTVVAASRFSIANANDANNDTATTIEYVPSSEIPDDFNWEEDFFDLTGAYSIYDGLPEGPTGNFGGIGGDPGDDENKPGNNPPTFDPFPNVVDVSLQANCDEVPDRLPVEFVLKKVLERFNIRNPGWDDIMPGDELGMYESESEQESDNKDKWDGEHDHNNSGDRSRRRQLLRRGRRELQLSKRKIMKLCPKCAKARRWRKCLKNKCKGRLSNNNNNRDRRQLRRQLNSSSSSWDDSKSSNKSSTKKAKKKKAKELEEKAKKEKKKREEEAKKKAKELEEEQAKKEKRKREEEAKKREEQEKKAKKWEEEEMKKAKEMAAIKKSSISNKDSKEEFLPEDMLQAAGEIQQAAQTVAELAQRQHKRGHTELGDLNEEIAYLLHDKASLMIDTAHLKLKESEIITKKQQAEDLAAEYEQKWEQALVELGQTKKQLKYGDINIDDQTGELKSVQQMENDLNLVVQWFTLSFGCELGVVVETIRT